MGIAEIVLKTRAGTYTNTVRKMRLGSREPGTSSVNYIASPLFPYFWEKIIKKYHNKFSGKDHRKSQ